MATKRTAAPQTQNANSTYIDTDQHLVACNDVAQISVLPDSAGTYSSYLCNFHPKARTPMIHDRLQHRLTNFIAALISSLFVASSFAMADDFPQWRGVNRDGFINENNLMKELPEGELPRKWSVPIGSGYSGPTVAKGKVYLTDRGIGESDNQVERILCFDEESGKQICERTSNEFVNTTPTATEKTPNAVVTMSDVLDMAKSARLHLSTTLNDYTARFVKQEQDASGTLAPESEILMKVQTRCRNEKNDAPMRVYLAFNKPQNLKGREVIWGADLFDGTMAVHEVGLLLGLKTLWLDPTGFLAMQGQRYPISEIGIMKLID